MAIPGTHCNTINDNDEIRLQMTINMKENKNIRIRNQASTDIFVSTRTPAINGKSNLRKGAFFQILFFCFLWNFMPKEFSFSEATILINETDGHFPIFYGTRFCCFNGIYYRYFTVF